MKKQIFHTVALLIALSAHLGVEGSEIEKKNLKSRLKKFAPFSRNLPGNVLVVARAEIRTGDELIKKKDRHAQAAVKAEALAIIPEVKPSPLDKKSMEPVDPKNKKFLAPVFLVDPMFTEGKPDEEIEVFRGNDWAGYQQPRVESKWPIYDS